MRVLELKQYLVKSELSNYVWISEDATRVVEKFEYDPKTNQIIGFVPPLDNSRGIPKILSFSAKSALDIYNIFKNNTGSKFINVIIAQPLHYNQLGFCLCIYGTDNKYKTTDVIKRWKYIVDKLKENDIEVLGN